MYFLSDPVTGEDVVAARQQHRGDRQRPRGAAGEAEIKEPHQPESLKDRHGSYERDAGGVRAAMEMVDRMLKLAWLDAGADEVRPEPIDLDVLVEGCAAIGRPLAEAQGLSFQVEAEKAATPNGQPDLEEANRGLPPGWQAIWDAASDANLMVGRLYWETRDSVARG